KVIVTLTVIPQKKYSISKDDIKVYATLPTSARATRGIEISSELKLEGDDPKDLSEKRDYTVTIDSKLGLWVRTAVFTNTRKGVVKTTSKFYFIANNASYNSSVTTNNYYFVPAADPHQANKQDAWYSSNYNVSNGDPEKPFITTFKTQCDNNSIWEIISFYEEGEDDEYLYSHIKHWATGKYLIYEPPHSNVINRKCVHLQTTASPGDNAQFDIITNGTGVNIRPISLTSGNRFLNPASGNKDFYYGQGSSPYYGGMVGVYNETSGGSLWHLEETIEPPSFTVNADGTVEISSATGTTVHYLTDGTDPTTSDGVYTGAITVTNDMTAIKAIAVDDNDNSKVSNVVTLPLQTYTYYIVNRAGEIAVKCELKQTVGKTLNSYLDIPADIQSPYLAGETVTFYTFSEAYSSTDQLNDENKITETPEADANIYVTYTTDHILEKFIKLNGASVFNITESNKCIYDDSGSLASETADYSTAIATANHLWNFFGEDPYAVQIQNFDTNNFLVFSTPLTLSVAATATNNFILMEESAAANADHESVSLMVATGAGTPDYTTKAVSAYPVGSSVTYHLIDKAGKLIVSVPSTSSELALPDEWVSPLVSEYQYYKGATLSGDAVGSSCDFTGATTITSPFDVGSGGNIYVT
ncbi:MAG: chitobiase/beta-hexosaminidase C-terminal domain-containing protein, partial [Bacteroidales bacterium]|nr:chitobiase/beta-hexosaminidase C-terminal domain-containing protein [Bacteroidales bacterium]